MIADQPHSLSQSPLEKDFEAGVHFGIGGFNLVSGTDGISADITIIPQAHIGYEMIDSPS